MNKYLTFQSVFLFITISTVQLNCMDRPVENSHETDGQFIERTRTLALMNPYNGQGATWPRFQFDAYGKRKIEMGKRDTFEDGLLYRSTKLQMTNKKGTVYHNVLPRANYTTVAVSSDGKMVALTEKIIDYERKDVNIDLVLLKIIRDERVKRLQELKRLRIMGPESDSQGLYPECMDFNKQGTKIIVWGMLHDTACKMETPTREHKFFSLIE